MDNNNYKIHLIDLSGAREAVLDFTKPYFMESITIVSRAPAEKSRAVAVFSPFTPGVRYLFVFIFVYLPLHLSVYLCQSWTDD